MNGNVLMCSGVFWSTSLLWKLFIAKSTLGTIFVRGTFGNGLDLHHLQQLYYLQAEFAAIVLSSG
jgi:hypothetical protein